MVTISEVREISDFWVGVLPRNIGDGGGCDSDYCIAVVMVTVMI